MALWVTLLVVFVFLFGVLVGAVFKDRIISSADDEQPVTVRRPTKECRASIVLLRTEDSVALAPVELNGFDINRGAGGKWSSFNANSNDMPYDFETQEWIGKPLTAVITVEVYDVDTDYVYATRRMEFEQAVLDQVNTSSRRPFTTLGFRPLHEREA